jgi:hypothetical protein
LVAIGLGDLAYARAFRDESGITFPLLVDAERLAYRAAGLGSASLLHVLRPGNIAAGLRARAAPPARKGAPFQPGSLPSGPRRVATRT